MTGGACIVFLLSVAAAAAPPTVRVEKIDSTSVTGRLTALDGERVSLRETHADKPLAPIPLKDVEELHLREAKDAMETAGRPVVVTGAGDLVACKSVSVKDGKVDLAGTELGDLSLPLHVVSMIYLPVTGQTAGAVGGGVAKLNLGQPKQDELIVVRQSGWIGVPGVLKGMEGKEIVFAWKGEDRRIKTETVRAIRLAATADVSKPAAGVLTYAEGSRVAFRSLQCEGGQFEAVSAVLGRLKIPAGKVASVRFHSDRVRRLADLKPASVREYGFLDTATPHRVNRSAGGKPLRLGGREYRTGLGLHSFCEITYELDGEFNTFVAVAGIDDAVRPRGDAELTILGDGKPLLDTTRLTGKTEPLSVRLDVKGVKILTVRVGFGPDKLDVSDHVNLAAARLIR